ncbi:BrnA antitoxin family protein [Paraburkholderia sp.]|uniref:BrnA antitoxin family protein n=1 Tax=Paraburkholderia sp. TaxID=1926495 RepID=UPI0026348931|nr:BrnA antitoxin family protein [Paraburkholderia sp.]
MNAKKSGLHSALAKVDSQRIKKTDYDEIPELGDEFFQGADEDRAGELVRRGRGRPTGSNKAQMNLRIDLDVIEAYKAQGEGWQTRMNDALRDWAKSHGMMR